MRSFSLQIKEPMYLFLTSLHLESVPLPICERFRGPIKVSLMTKAQMEPIELMQGTRLLKEKLCRHVHGLEVQQFF